MQYKILQLGKTSEWYSEALKTVLKEKPNTIMFICKNMSEAKRQYNNFMQYIDEQKSIIIKSFKQTKHKLIITFKNNSTLVFTMSSSIENPSL